MKDNDISKNWWSSLNHEERTGILIKYIGSILPKDLYRQVPLVTEQQKIALYNEVVLNKNK